MTEFVYRPIIVSAKTLFSVLGIRFDVVGTEFIPRTGGAVIAMNHTSYLDFALGGVPADMTGHRLVRFMAKEGIWRNPIAGPLMRGMKHIPVDRDSGSQAFKDAVRAARDGELIGIFPEATMSRSFEVKEIKNGAVRIAMSANVPLIPMIVFGGQRILGYDHRDFTRGRTVVITVGEPMHPTRGEDGDALTAELKRRLEVLLDESIDRYPPADPGHDAWWLPKRRGGTAPTLDEAEAIEVQVRRDKAAKRAAKGKG